MHKLESLPKAVLFDFDGVVVNSFDVHESAWKKAFYEVFESQMPPFPASTHEGKSPISIATYFCETKNQKEKSSLLYDLKGNYLHNSGIPPNLLPGIHEITDFLERRNIAYGIASNATKQFIKNSIDQLDLMFDVFTGFEDYVNPKPHPEPYLKLAERLGFSSNDFSEIWILEDSVTGIQAAHKAGMQPIGIRTKNSNEKLIAAGAVMTFPTVKEVFDFAKGL